MASAVSTHGDAHKVCYDLLPQNISFCSFELDFQTRLKADRFDRRKLQGK